MAKTPNPNEEIAKVLDLVDLNKAEDGELFKTAGMPRTDMIAVLDNGLIQKYADNFTPKAELFKSVGIPPDMQPFTRLSTMPDQTMSGLLQWPGALPGTLKKIVHDHLAPQMIIFQRVADVLQYSKLSSHVWKPGWRVETKIAGKPPSNADMKTIREAETFLLNCNIEITNPRERDAHKLTSFSKFLASLVRNSLTYDGIAIWTDMAQNGKIKAFAALDASVIRLVNPEAGYKGDKRIFAVAINEALQVVKTFTRDELIWSVRNPRVDPDSNGYGLAECEVAGKIIQAYSNAFELNMDAFNKNSIPQAILKLKGAFNQKQLDFWNRIWTNIKKGAAKNWTLPVVRIPTDGDIDILDLTRMKGNEVYYKEFINMLMGAYCAVYRFPVHRFGYKTSGMQKDEEQEALPEWIDEQDLGKIELLNHIENLINEYFIWANWPHLQFTFTGKSPKEDSREFQNRSLSMTIDERRASSDLPPLHELIDQMDIDAEEKEKDMLKSIARLIGLAPTDPGLSGVFQSIVSAMIKSGADVGVETPGAQFPGQTDPAKVKEHGHVGGLRRNSRAERGNAKAAKKKSEI